VRYCDYLHASVLLIGSAALALMLVSAGALAQSDNNRTMIVVSIGWIVLCLLAGWIAGRGGAQDAVRELISRSRPEPIFPQIDPAGVLMSRLWPVLTITVIAAVSSYWFSQLAVAAAGLGLFWALVWRRQSDAVLAIEERDLVHFWIVRSSPFKSPKLIRVPAM
jgi:hypothetical protein